MKKMLKSTRLQLVCAALAVLFGAMCANAAPLTAAAVNSKLASGKWVKITIPDNGVYEITFDEMIAMGFSNPANVRLYGSGGVKISETLTTGIVDDLKAVPVLRLGDKIVFYGQGPISYKVDAYSTMPNITREFNPYSQVGCYFLGEVGGTEAYPYKKSNVTVPNYVDQPTSLNFFMHENELVTISNSGKEMLGEEFSDGRTLIDYYLPDLAGNTVVVRSQIAANASDVTYASAALHSGGAVDTANYTASAARIYSPGSNSYIYYNYSQPYGEITLTHPEERGQYEPLLTVSSANVSVKLSRLDYFIITYPRTSVLREDMGNQTYMAFGKTTGRERFMLPGASSDVKVWYINTPSAPQVLTLNPYDEREGSGQYFFSSASNYSQYVAFDPTKTLKKVTSYEAVPNQNLHGMATPDMLIITVPEFVEQAQRIADLHQAVDGMDVAVVTQDQVFNEFSSGTRDAMAYRMMCKMLYDRDSTKFKNLLLFGPGSVDNRELLGEHPLNLLTYQSDNSNYEDFSFTSDDFFGLLDDNSGTNISSDKLCIGVGRYTCADVEEAKSDVDKLVEYYANPDYGVWRNRSLVMSDSPDKGIYMFQGEGYRNLIDNDLSTGMNADVVHNSMFPRSNTEPNVALERKTATEAKAYLSGALKEGAYYFTYVGHAGPLCFTKYNNLWTTGDVVRTNYSHWPIMSTACCDVAHYDGNSRGIAELMFHKREGGAIALLATSRMVFATGNDQLNTAFVKAMFSRETLGRFPTLGEAYKQCKRALNGSNTNKMSFFLLGDPAIKVNYPITRFNITKVNNTAMTGDAMAGIRPLMQFDIEAQVVDDEGNLDTSFNGDATLTLYDRKDQFTTLSFQVSSQMVDRDIYFNRDRLTEVTGRVVNGVFHGTMIVPKSPLAKDQTVLLRSYAHKDNTDYMVNGFTENVTMLPYDDNAAIHDNQAPVITSMFINDEAGFAAGARVGSDGTLYITATDDMGINTQSNSIDNGMTLVLDAGKNSTSDITSYATIGDGGKTVSITYPLSNLSDGLHTLTYTVYDMAGNSATRTITFMVGAASTSNIVADKQPAFQDGEVNFAFESELSGAPSVIVRVTDATGKLVWMTETASFPVTWDMKDMNGNTVPAGLYRYYATFNDNGNYGGTPINKLIVLEPLKSNK